MSAKTIERYEAREEAPTGNRSKSTLPAVAAAAGVRTEWLKSGQGEMLLPGQGDGATGEAPAGRGSEEVPPGDVRGIDFPEIAALSDEVLGRFGLYRILHISVEADLGGGNEVQFEEVNGSTILPVEVIRREFGVDPGRVRRITATGRSMEPTIRAGEGVYVVILKPNEEPRGGGIYLMRGPHGLIIKRLYFESEIREEEGKEVVRNYVRLWSDNEEAGRDRLPLEVFERDYFLIAAVRKTEKYL